MDPGHDPGHDDRPIAQVIDAYGRVVPDAVFVQVGAHDGTALDPLRRQVVERRWTGVMVEPVPYVFERLRAAHGDNPRVALVNAAVADADGTRTLHYLREAGDDPAVWPYYDALASFRREVVLGHRHLVPDIDERIAAMDVPCITFDTLCERHGLDHVDVVQIDTEGYDLDVLELVDLPRRRPAIVLFEHLHLDDDERERATQLLDDHGYDQLADGMDTLGVRAEVLAGHPELASLWRRLRDLRPTGEGPTARLRRTARRAVSGVLGRAGYELRRAHPADADDLPLVDRSTPLPPEAAELRDDHPRLVELRGAYDALDWPVVRHSRWRREAVSPWLDLARFRGDNAYVWHYRESRRVSELKYFLFLEHVAAADHAGLLARLEEDGAFGCWTYRFPGRPPVSRDLLDSVSELSFLDRCTGVLGADGARVLDVGAGYGRLAHRLAVAAPALGEVRCADAVAESTFLSEWYLRYRGVVPPAGIVALTDVPDLEPGAFDLACNVHSWSECTRSAIRWWVDQLARLEVPRLFVVPNEPEGFLSLERDGRRLDYRSVLEAAGYRLAVEEHAFADAAVRSLLGIHDRYCLFEAC